MNFVFISPQFPYCYRHFCMCLRSNGANVLAIGDSPYDQLHPQLRDSLTEYYRVCDMENYDQMLRAVAYFTFKYGKIDFLESNNEYWLEQDARLREDFHITSGLMPRELYAMKHKSAMKAFYQKAGVPTARWHLLSWDRDAAWRFADAVGYPLMAKPDSGVGAVGNVTIHGPEDLERLLNTPLREPYLLEEFVSGVVSAFDGVVNGNGEIVFCASHITPVSIMDMVHNRGPMYYYVPSEVSADLQQAGEAVLRAFGVKRRSFHLEFFRLTEAKEGLGNVGDIVGLEVNMRPAGGYTPDMMNYSQSSDYYQLWADMVCFDEARHWYDGPHRDCLYVGRWDERRYRHGHDEICRRYGDRVKDSGELQGILHGSMGDSFFILNADSEGEREEMTRFILEEC
jgi:hypothetical protein